RLIHERIRGQPVGSGLPCGGIFPWHTAQKIHLPFRHFFDNRAARVPCIGNNLLRLSPRSLFETLHGGKQFIPITGCLRHPHSHSSCMLLSDCMLLVLAAARIFVPSCMTWLSGTNPSLLSAANTCVNSSSNSYCFATRKSGIVW